MAIPRGPIVWLAILSWLAICFASVVAGHAAFIPVFGVGLLLAVFAIGGYRRPRPGHALVVYGKVSAGRAVRIVLDRGAFVWPVIQRAAYLDLRPFTVDGRRVGFGRNAEQLERAAIRLLLLPREDVEALARDALAAGELDKLGLVLL